jgi:hypothetical protein
MSTTKPASLYALAINKNREQLDKAIAHEEKYGPAWRQCQERHSAAWLYPRRGSEVAIVGAIKAWLNYGDQYAAGVGAGDPIGTDGYAAPYWQTWGEQLRGLLSMDLGRLDGGTLDGILMDAAKAAGVEEFGQ